MKKITKNNVAIITCIELDPNWYPGTREFNSSRPVFAIKFEMASKFEMVLKGELNSRVGKINENSLRLAARVMHQSDSAIDVEIAEESEVEAIRLLAQKQFAVGFREITDAEQKRVNQERSQAFILNSINNNDYIFCKMPFVHNLRSASALEKSNMADAATKQKVAQRILKKLKDDSQAVVALGKIVAADLFNGNTDRFDPVDGRLINPGNILFEKQDDKKYKPIGLDFFESQGENSNYYQEPNEYWGGIHLSDEESIMRYAHMVISELNETFRRAAGSNSMFSYELLGNSHVESFAYGMRMAAHSIREDVLSINRSPKGLAARIRMLGWDKPREKSPKKKRFGIF